MDEKSEVEIVLKHLSVLRAEPGDMFVLRVPGLVTATGAFQIRETLAEYFGPDTKLLVLEGGAELGVVRFTAGPGG